MKVTILPTPLTEGWESMNRYWASLQKEFRGNDSLNFLLGESKSGVSEGNKCQRLWVREVAYPFKIRRSPRPDVYHILDHSYADLARHTNSDAGLVMMAHDLCPILDPVGLSEKQVQRFAKRISNLRKANRVLCISNFTLESIHELLGIPRERLETVYLAVGEEFFEASIEKWSGPELPHGRKNLLVVGNSLPRKNLRSIPGIIAALGNDAKKFGIVKAGQNFPPEIKAELVELLGENGVLELGFVPEEDLPHLYAASFALLFPSLLEGFGLPIVEAMAAGCPVVSSKRASLPEVVGEAGFLYDPDHPEEAASLIKKLACDHDLRDDMIRRGKVRAKEFSWEKHANRVLAVYEEVYRSGETALAVASQ